MLGHERRARAVEIRVVRRPGRESVDVAITQAEKRGDKDGVVNLEVSGAVLTRAGDILGGDALATFGGLAGDYEQRLQLVRNCRALQVRLDLQDEVLVTIEMVRGNRAMNRLAVPAVRSCDETNVAISSRSPGESVCGPRSRTSASWLIGAAVSGRNAIGPRIPGRPSGSDMWGIGDYSGM